MVPREGNGEGKARRLLPLISVCVSALAVVLLRWLGAVVWYQGSCMSGFSSRNCYLSHYTSAMLDVRGILYRFSV